MPEGAAYEWARSERDRDGVSVAEWKRYFVATGAGSTPSVEVIYYEPKSKKYLTIAIPGTKLTYR